MRSFDLIKYLIAIGVAFLIFNQITRTCGGSDSLSVIEERFNQTKAEIAEINKGNSEIMASLDSLRKARVQQNNYYKYEITKIDSVYALNPSAGVVDSVIRFWTDRIYSIPGFFNNIKQTGIADGKQDSTAGGELLLPGLKLERGNGPAEDSSW